MSNKPVLAQLKIPDQTLLLYENMVIKDPDRTGNWRFFFRQDGCFFNARNTQLWLTETAQFKSDDPALFWNTPFPTTPNRCLTEAQQSELLAAIQESDFASLKAYYSSPTTNQTSSPQIERWTVVQEDEAHTVIVENKAAPASLVELRATIDRLVAEAPRPEAF